MLSSKRELRGRQGRHGLERKQGRIQGVKERRNLEEKGHSGKEPGKKKGREKYGPKEEKGAEKRK